MRSAEGLGSVLIGEGPVVVVGVARTGLAVVDLLLRHGLEVQAIDDRPSAATASALAGKGVELTVAPSGEAVKALVAGARLVVASPGVPASHPVLRAASEKAVSEIELAARLLDAPIVAITGTNGKTSVTTLVADMLVRSGRRAAALGNIGAPLIGVVEDPDLEIAIVEVSSFQLALTSTFRPAVGTWLNVAEDHLDWHPDYEDYVGSKARIWANQGPSETAIANAEDPEVLARARASRARVVTFGLESGDYRRIGSFLVGPENEQICEVGALPRAFPHDLANALAAVATARSAGADIGACRDALAAGIPLPHRVELVGEAGGVRFFDDSKATTPSAVIAALQSFASPVLIAGGRNKGLDLGAIPRALEAAGETRLRAVVAIGEAAPEVERAFAGCCPIEQASSMREAVVLARGLARAGDEVILSPGCASFDWYESYVARGEDFAREVRHLLASSDRVVAG